MLPSSVNGSPQRSPMPSPAGMLLGEFYSGRKSSNKWAAADRIVSLGQVLVGVLVLALSIQYLYQFTETTGIFLGALLIATGALGYVGGTKRNPNLVNLQLVATIVGILLAFQFMGEVVRDAQVDCALAELYHRGKATERAVDSVRQTETMHAVFNRLNELEDTLNMVQQGAASHVDLRREQQALRFTDLNYIRAKVEMVKRHAEDVLSSVLKNDSVNAETIAVMTDAEKAALRRRLDVADRVMERIQKAHGGAGSEDLTFEEYKEILGALTDLNVVPDKADNQELQQALRELPNMQAAMQRQRADAYHTLMVGTAGVELQRLQEQRKQKREQWASTFQNHLDRQHVGGKDYVADLPEHCVKETSGERAVVVAGVAMVLLQLAAAYISLSLSFRLPTKAE